jgi:GH15 family glucan-1,4-alpha-glucosidase
MTASTRTNGMASASLPQRVMPRGAGTGRHLSNFPQAFSHLALVEAAARLIVAEGLAEVAG